MNASEIKETGEKLEMIKENLFAVKAALFHGEIDGPQADGALLFIIDALGTIADKLKAADQN